MYRSGKILTKSDYYDLFFKIRNAFNSNKDGEYDKFLHKTDQVLRNISMYLIENFKGDYEGCVLIESGKYCSERCNYLNTWLNEKKAIYTSNGRCSYYNELWKLYVEDLWNEIDKTINPQHKCTRNGTLSKTEFPKEKLSLYCNMNASEVLSYTFSDKTYANTCTTILTMSYVALGIVIIYLYLFKFSTLGNRIKNLVKNKIGVSNHMDEQENEELLRSSQNDTMP
ncbi:PIR protein [Plasmodium ovale]|uniref:PIR protein n=1 Tax=Plasmodium ovale TaxID=36330 RepID=A0A1D3JDX4_PLAOA|nr:PIR protein [Plasmodium ovale]